VHVLGSSPIEGVYQAQQNNCNYHFEIRYLNFVFFFTGPCESGTSIYWGKYDITPTDPHAISGTMTVTYTSKWSSSGNEKPSGGGGPFLGGSYVFFWTKMNNQLNMTSPLFPDMQYTRVPKTKIDGTWCWVYDQQGQACSDLNAGVLLSFTYTQGTSAPVVASYELSHPNDLNVDYAFGPPGLAGTTGYGNYSFSGTALNLDVFIEARKQYEYFVNGVPGVPFKAVEGTWIGATVFPATNQSDAGFCLTCIEFHNSFWRAFQTQCSPSNQISFGTFLGTFDMDSNNIELTYGFVDVNGQGDVGIQGQTLTFEYKFVSTPSQPMETQLVISQPNDPTQPTMTFTQM